MFKIIFCLLLFSYSPAEMTIKIATLAPESSAWGKALKSVIRDLFLQTQKELKLRFFWGGQMGDEAEIVQKIQLGQLDGAALTGNGLGQVCSQIRVLELPFLFENTQEIDFVYNSIFEKIQPYFRKNRIPVELIALSETGFCYFFSKKNIRSLQDITKTRMWVWKGDSLAESAFRILKIPSVPIGFTEVTTSLQTGMIDGFYCTPTAAVSLQWFREVQYMLSTPLCNVSGGFIIRSATWKKIKESHRVIFSQLLKTSLEKLTLLNRESDLQTVSYIQKAGITVNPPIQEKSLFQNTLEETAKDMIQKEIIEQNLYSFIKNILQEIRK